MPEIGHSSGTAEEDDFIDIPVDTELLGGYAPVAPSSLLGQSDSEEDDPMDMAEPVRGRVMRSGSPDSDEELVSTDDPAWSDESEEDPTEIEVEGAAEEVPAERSPVYHPFEDETFEGYADPTLEQTIEHQNARITHLEEQDQVHQDMEEQYRTLIHELLGEKAQLVEIQRQKDQRIAELEDEAQDFADSVEYVGTLVHQVVARNTELTAQKEQVEVRLAGKETVLEVMTARYDREVADKIRIDVALGNARSMVDDLERQVQVRSAWNDSLSFAMDSAVSRMRGRVWRYPAHDDYSTSVVSRPGVDKIICQEYEDAVRRTMQ